MSFVHLHNHSHYSLLDGLGKPKDIVNKAKEDGSPAVGLTDHGVLYGIVEFYKAAKNAGIKPIIGCEIYVAPGSRFDKTPGPENRPYHLVLLAENYMGYKNLLYLVSNAHIEGFYYKPRVDYGLLKAHHEGLIALSACLAGELPRTILEKSEKEQIECIKKYQDIFGKNNYFIELQDHPMLDDQKIVNDRIIELSKKTGAPMVATQDAHYVNKEDDKAQDILVCIQTQTTLHEEDRLKFEGDFSLKSPEEMKKAFRHVPEAIENTVKIAERCNTELEFGLDLIPKFNTPNNIDSGKYLRQLCEEGIMKKYNNDPPKEAREKLNYELDIVDKMGFNDYFLIVWDFVKFAKDSKITVGPGRGSAAGSLITYCLDITELDPLKHGLIFERFLNPERISMPDIDIDFADVRRDEVLDYVRKKYGQENVAQIITFGTMAAKAAIRDVGRVMGYPYAEVDRIAKMVPAPILGKYKPLATYIEEDPELKKVYHSEERVKDLLDNAIKLEGTVRHAGTHASAVVMSQEPLVNYTPLQLSPGDHKEIITQYDMKVTEEIGLLKMDFLGLRNLTIIQLTLQIIDRTKGKKIDLSTIPMNDQKTFELLQKGDTTGVFQLESAGMRRYIKKLKPDCFEDIVAMISLYRPGPMEWIPAYIKGKHNPETIRYFHPSFESILKETNGVAIYQEQILQIARDFAGFTLGEADILRKAVGKKNPVLLKEQKDKFIEDSVKKGHDKSFAEQVFEKVIEPFAGYGFNKAHAACYAMISYRTAYLKAHFPTEFMAALLSVDSENADRVSLEIMECEEMGIAVLPPSINDSFSSFTVVDDSTIRFGLSAIKGLGINTIEELIESRKNGRYKSLEEFLERVPIKSINKKTIECLAYSGALDEFGERNQLAENYEDLVTFSRNAEKVKSEGQTNIFGAMEFAPNESPAHLKLKKTAKASLLQKLQWEKEYLGLYVSSHPLKGLRKYLSKKIKLIDDLTKRDIGKNLKMGGLVSNVKKVYTKAGAYMAYGELEDPTGRIELVIFPKIYNQYQHLFDEGNILVMEGRLDYRNDRIQFSCNSAKSVSLEKMIQKAKEDGLYNHKEKIIRKQKTFEEMTEGQKKKSGGSKSDPYVIDLPESIDSKKLEMLKGLLTESKGKTKVELHIKGKKGVKRIKVPFTVDITDDLETEINELIVG
jgi:DNA polymerase-3 subunit alpha